MGFGLLLACGIANTVVGSDVFCLTEKDCKQRQKELGLTKYKSGRYGNMGHGCFSKHSTLYWSKGGSFKEMTAMDLGSSEKKRVMCGEAELISTVAPTNEPTPAVVVTATPTEETVFIIPIASDDEPIDEPIDENGNGTVTPPESTNVTETENEVTTNSTLAELTPNNETAYQNMTAQDDTATANGTTYPSIETEVDEDLEEAVLEGELVETYLTDSKQNETAARLLQIGVAVFAVALLLVAAFIHRSRQISQDRNVDSIATAAATDFRPESFDIETGGSDDLPQNSIEVFDAASEEIDDMEDSNDSISDRGKFKKSF